MNFVRDFFVNTTFLFIFCNFACSDNRTRIDRLLTKTEVKTIRLKKTSMVLKSSTTLQNWTNAVKSPNLRPTTLQPN